MRKRWRVGGVPEHFNLPWRLAIESGAFERAGLEVSWEDYPAGTGAQCEALEQDRLDVAVLLTEGVTAYLARGGDARLVGTYVETPLAWGVHVLASGPLQTIEDTRGRTFGISRPGSGSHVMALLLADGRGWDDPPLVTVGGLEGARAAMGSGQAEVFMWEQVMTKPMVDSGIWRSVGVFSAPWPAFVIAVRGELVEEEQALRTLLKVTQESCAALRAAPDAAATISARYQLSEADVAAWLSRTQWRCEPGVHDDALNRVLDALEAADALGAARPELASLSTPWARPLN
jgi:sulfonate transport system substrate-binding protein